MVRKTDHDAGSDASGLERARDSAGSGDRREEPYLQAPGLHERREARDVETLAFEIDGSQIGRDVDAMIDEREQRGRGRAEIAGGHDLAAPPRRVVIDSQDRERRSTRRELERTVDHDDRRTRGERGREVHRMLARSTDDHPRTTTSSVVTIERASTCERLVTHVGDRVRRLDDAREVSS